MREILFRGKRDENDEWVFGDLIHEPWASCIQVTEQVIENNNIDIFKRTKYSVHKETVGQYTGLLDKNIERIFDGDILKLDGEDGFFVLEFQDDTARFVMSGDSMVVDFDNFRSYEVEVIGNIHDNPELLKEGGEE